MYDIEFCTENQVREFYAEFGATEETVKRDVQCLIKWLQNEPHLPNVTDEDWLSNILLRAKNDVERAKKLLETYYMARYKMPKIFENRSYGFVSKVEQLMNFAAFCPMPKLTTDGHRIIILHFYNRKDSKDILPDVEDFLKIIQLIYDLNLKTDKVKGVTMIYDLDNIGIAFLRILIPALRKVVTLQTRINPIRYNRIYVLNAGVVALPLVTLGKTLITKESEKIMVWKKKSTNLSEVLPAECLPKEYGGTLPSIRNVMESYFEFGKNYMDWLRSEEKIAADMSKKKPVQRQSSYERLKSMGESIRKYYFEVD